MIPDAIRIPAEAAGLDPLKLAAVVEVESGGVDLHDIGGEMLPAILYEFHVFWRVLPREHRQAAAEDGLAAPQWGDLPYPRSMAARYALLGRAQRFCAGRGLPTTLAFAACSWGVGQVLGENAAWLGYADAEALAAEAFAGVDGQVRLMVRFIARAGLKGALNAGDWAAFARGYNGPGQVERYAGLMRAAWERLSGRRSAIVLRIGARGAEVRLLQQALADLDALRGEPVDGAFGPATEAAVRAFQTAQGLTADGVVGAMTWSAIDVALGARVAPAQPTAVGEAGKATAAVGGVAGLALAVAQVEAAAALARDLGAALERLGAAAGPLLEAGAPALAGLSALAAATGLWLWLRDRRPA